MIEWEGKDPSSAPVRPAVAAAVSPPVDARGRCDRCGDIRSALRPCGVVLAVLLVIALSACGGEDKNLIVVRVGTTTVTKATVDRWTGVVTRGGAFSGFRGAPLTGTPKQRALALLISSRWLQGEAARQGVPVSENEVNAALAERMRGAAASEFRERLKAIGQTIAGVKLELRAELALEAIREVLLRRADQFTSAEVRRFYRRNTELFSAPKVSVVDIIENLPSSAAAKALVRRVGGGPRFAKLALHKELAYTPSVLVGAPSKKEVDRAIYTARPGVVSQPMRLLQGWTVFVVRKVIPPRALPFATVRGAVVTKLKEGRKREITTKLANEYERRWVARTHCLHGYVVSGCVESRGRLSVYEDPFSGE